MSSSHDVSGLTMLGQNTQQPASPDTGGTSTIQTGISWMTGIALSVLVFVIVVGAIIHSAGGSRAIIATVFADRPAVAVAAAINHGTALASSAAVAVVAAVPTAGATIQ